MVDALPAVIEADWTDLGSALPIPAQADSDRELVAMWVARSASPGTRRKYRAQAARFLAFVAKPLALVRLGDVQAYLATLEGQAPATRANATAALKSLFSFAQELGYLRFNVGKAVKAPPVKNTLAERILAEPDTLLMIRLEPNARNRALLTLLYGAGLRISEVTGLRWRDLAERDGAGQVTVYGKGGKTRVVLLPASVWQDVQALAVGDGAVDPNAPVFRSRRGGHLTTRQAQRLVDAAAARAGIRAGVSPHWLRHAHATHALERGAPIHLVQQTLGHASVAPTGRYLHARPTESSAQYLAI